MRHVRYVRDGRIRIAVEADGDGRFEEVIESSMLDVLTAGGTGAGLTLDVTDASRLELDDVLLLTPIDPPEVWCAGLTYERSRVARQDEAVIEDVYSLAYDAERPELFLKDAMWRRTVGHGQPIAVRSDSSWSVPEPELALVLGSRGTMLGMTIGNDVSARDIEGANPLYLPQAKVYAGGCAIGPSIYVPRSPEEEFEIGMRIVDPARTGAVRGDDVDHAHAPLVRGSRRVARPRQPGSRRERAPHRHRPGAPRLVLAPTRAPRRDPRASDRNAREHRRLGRVARLVRRLTTSQRT